MMRSLKRVSELIFDKKKRFNFMIAHNMLTSMSDVEFLKKQYKLSTGKTLNLDNPVSFNEKIQWLKLFDRKSLYTDMVDKYEAKELFKNKIGEKYIIKTIGVYDSFDQILFEDLPKQFVIKTTHDSGGVVICKDKDGFDYDNARRLINEHLAINHFNCAREWAYKNVKPRIIIEEYLDSIERDSSAEYKIFCFDGNAQFILVCTGNGHGDNRTNDFYDMEFNHLPVSGNYPNSEKPLDRPDELDEMVRIAEIIAEEIIQLRVDFYLTDGKIYIGEATFYHDAGYCKFFPPEWDTKFGEFINLPIKDGKK